MKKVMILFGKSNWRKSKPFENKDYQYSYEYFYELCKKGGIQMYRASYQWYDYKKNIFKYAWIYEGMGAKWKKVYNIKPDLIYDKTKARMEVYYKKELIAEHYPFINDLDFTKIIDDKFVISAIFSRYCKKNYLVNNLQELKAIVDRIKTDKIVVKPICESGGNGVMIINKKDLKNINIPNKSLAQEFIDSSHGVPGVSNKMHDLRLVFVNAKLIYAYIREPQEGSYLANLAQGGSLIIVPKKNIPAVIWPIINNVQEVFESFNPRVFTVDFMFDEQGTPWIVELNSMPGLYFTKAEKPYMEEMYAELLKVFKEKMDRK